MSDYTDGDYIYDTQWLAMKRGIHGDAIFSGLAPSVVSGMTTRLATGSYFAGATKVTVGAAVDFVHGASDATYDRWDLIYGTSAAQGKLEGGPALIPAPPDLPTGAVILYMVRIRAAITTILAGDLYEFGFTSSLMEHASRHYSAGSDPITPANIGAEPAFSKNTAFNKNFGTGTADVPEIGATLIHSNTVETDGTGKLITATKNTAYNKSFGTGTANVPEIGVALGNSSIVETNSAGKLITAAKGTAFNQAFETSTANIKMNGSVAVGTSTNIPRADHVHASDTSRAPTSHAVDASTYGYGSASVFGHLKVGGGLSVGSGLVSLATHDKAYHTNRTRTVHGAWCNQFWLASGTEWSYTDWYGVTSAALPTGVSTGTNMRASFTLPDDFVSGSTIYAKIYYAPSATTSDNWSCIIGARRLIVGGTTTLTQFSATLAAGTVDKVQVATISGGTALDAGDIVEFYVSRFGTSTSDTFGGTIYFLGVKFEYTADM